MPFLFILFIVIPIVEITILINVGEAIGAWYTIALVILSAFIGVNMLRYQGLSTLARAQRRMQSGEMPGQEMAEGLVLAMGGALLVTPGFVTDIIGFCCLIPFTRRALIHIVIARAKVVNMNTSSFHAQQDNVFKSSDSTRSPFEHEQPSGEVYEGDFHRDDEKK